MNKAFRTDRGWIYSMMAVSLAGSALYSYLLGGIEPGQGSLIWLVWSFFIAFAVGVEHPPVDMEEKLSPTRRVIGWLSMLIFILCISPNPIYMN